MKKILKGALSILMTVALTVPMFSMAVFADEAPVVKIPVTITMTGKSLPPTDPVNVVMKPVDGASPMPDGAADGVYTLATTGIGDYEMAPMTFQKVGIHDYTIHQEAAATVTGELICR